MKAVIQKVRHATVVVAENTVGRIGSGLLVLLGVGPDDTHDDKEWLAKKIINMRLFNDDEGVMNKSLLDLDGELMVISQFTLMARTKKGNRPSYINTAHPDLALPMYKSFVKECEILLGKKCAVGEFGSEMEVTLLNHGPVTIIVDTKNKE